MGNPQGGAGAASAQKAATGQAGLTEKIHQRQQQQMQVDSGRAVPLASALPPTPTEIPEWRARARSGGCKRQIGPLARACSCGPANACGNLVLLDILIWRVMAATQHCEPTTAAGRGCGERERGACEAQNQGNR